MPERIYVSDYGIAILKEDVVRLGSLPVITYEQQVDGCAMKIALTIKATKGTCVNLHYHFGNGEF